MEAISLRTPLPGRTNSGRMKSRGERDVSRMRSCTSGWWRRRRERAVGKEGCMARAPVRASGSWISTVRSVQYLLQPRPQLRREPGQPGAVNQADANHVLDVDLVL